MTTITYGPLKKAETNGTNSTYYVEATLVGDIFYDDEDLLTTPEGYKVTLFVSSNRSTAKIWVESSVEIPSAYSLTVVLPAKVFDSNELPDEPLVTLNFSDVAPLPVISPEPESVVITPKQLPVVVDVPDLFMDMEQHRFGEPVELYVFSYGKLSWQVDKNDQANVFRFTSSNEIVYRDEIIGGVKQAMPFTPETIKRDEIQHTTDMGRATLTVTVPKNNPVAKMFVPGTPVFPIAVQVFKAFTDPNSGVRDYMVMFTGRVSTCSFGSFDARITCDPIYSAIKRQGLRRKYEAGCPHNLFSVGQCNLSRANFALSNITGTNLDEYGSKITITDSRFTSLTTTYPEVRTATGLISVVENTVKNARTGADEITYVSQLGYYTGGIMELPDGSMHLISRQNPNSIELLRSINKNTDLAGMKLYPGCDHTFYTCTTRFQNQVNYGGFPWMPDTNPFVGTHVPTGG